MKRRKGTSIKETRYRGEAMKVIKNDCYGGFGVSQQAIFDLVKMNCEHISKRDFDEYFGRHIESLDEQFDNFGLNGCNIRIRLNSCKDWLDWLNYAYDVEQRKIYFFNNQKSSRTCPDLIKLIEEKGSMYCSSRHSQLVIIEVPDNACWEIEEYDGLESIVECYRVFG